MNVEEMDLKTYPFRAFQSPDGDSYPEPRPASNRWRIDYTDSNGYAKWTIIAAGFESPFSEISGEVLRIAEKRMEKPSKITAVKMGLVCKQEEPGGEWVRFAPNDKDPRAEIWYEGDYTEQYFNTWRKRAYEGYFDPFKLTRGYSVVQAAKKETSDKEKYIKELEAKMLRQEEENRRLIEKNNSLMKQPGAK